MIFVPSNWWHQVFNTSDCLSINHNWSNSFNLLTMWERLKEDLDGVRKELGHLRKDMRRKFEWERQVQRIFKAYAGINLVEFLEFLRVNAKHLNHDNKDDIDVSKADIQNATDINDFR